MRSMWRGVRRTGCGRGEGAPMRVRHMRPGGTGDILHWRLGGTSRGAAPTAPGNKWEPVSDPDATVTLLPASPIRRMRPIVNLSEVRVHLCALQGRPARTTSHAGGYWPVSGTSHASFCFLHRRWRTQENHILSKLCQKKE